jgi:hypothetical protein
LCQKLIKTAFKKLDCFVAEAVMKGLFGDGEPEVFEKIGNHIQKTELLAPVVCKNQTEKKVEAVQLGSPYCETAFFGQGIDIVQIKYRIDFFR